MEMRREAELELIMLETQPNHSLQTGPAMKGKRHEVLKI
jgi:hypothetical protein